MKNEMTPYFEDGALSFKDVCIMGAGYAAVKDWDSVYTAILPALTKKIQKNAEKMLLEDELEAGSIPDAMLSCICYINSNSLKNSLEECTLLTTFLRSPDHDVRAYGALVAKVLLENKSPKNEPQFMELIHSLDQIVYSRPLAFNETEEILIRFEKFNASMALIEALKNNDKLYVSTKDIEVLRENLENDLNRTFEGGPIISDYLKELKKISKRAEKPEDWRSILKRVMERDTQHKISESE